MPMPPIVASAVFARCRPPLRPAAAGAFADSSLITGVQSPSSSFFRLILRSYRRAAEDAWQGIMYSKRAATRQARQILRMPPSFSIILFLL
jgi:hypothetical protein